MTDKAKKGVLHLYIILLHLYIILLVNPHI